jgi:hypothetical protein
MGKPAWGHAHASLDEHIVWRGEPGELKHLSTRRKRDNFPSSGERKGNSPNHLASQVGLEGKTEGTEAKSNGPGKAGQRR